MTWIKNRIDAEYRKHKTLEWSKLAEVKITSTILDWCYKNNSVPMKDLIEGCEGSNLKLVTTDGGWVNVIQLQQMLKGEKDEV